MEILAIADIPAEVFGEPPRARCGETITVADNDGNAFIKAGIAVRADSPDATFFRDVRSMLAGKRD